MTITVYIQLSDSKKKEFVVFEAKEDLSLGELSSMMPGLHAKHHELKEAVMNTGIFYWHVILIQNQPIVLAPRPQLGFGETLRSFGEKSILCYETATISAFVSFRFKANSH